MSNCCLMAFSTLCVYTQTYMHLLTHTFSDASEETETRDTLNDQPEVSLTLIRYKEKQSNLFLHVQDLNKLIYILNVLLL